ncbi:unnamed protein product [Cylindrotheca closterium]|uniref:DUF6824 domain-containing protein n=1 Tax=Cylindrotheca closterium TaxID=2856 RepID=A0AAD2JHI3_9STRA|nr:unnamed protein product [Cylindrotheca closterium]
MASKQPPGAETTADIRSKRSLKMPPDERKGNATPEQIITTDNQNNLSSSRNNSTNASKPTVVEVSGSPCSSRTNAVDNSTMNASKPTMVPVSGSPRDIICGRGLHIMNHHGNHNLHLIVDRYRQAYLTSTRKDKADITRSIVQHLKSTGARFLRRFNHDGDDKWVEVDERTAYKKVGHALRLRKKDHGQNFLKSVVHRQQLHSQHSLPLHSASHGETSISHQMAAMSGGSQKPMNPPSRLPPSSSLDMHLPLGPPANQLQVMTTQSASAPALGPQPHPMLHSSVIGGYGNVVIDPRLFSQVFATTLSLMTQHQQRASIHGSSADSRRSDVTPRDERK